MDIKRDPFSIAAMGLLLNLEVTNVTFALL